MNNITIPWPDWTIVREIGRGGFGTVYEISRKEQNGSEEKAALKVISIPNEAEVINQFRMDGYDDASISARLKEDARKIQQEYYLQNQMKGHPNIVQVDDNMVTAHSDGLGWDIFIRMELLRPMMEVLMKKQDFSEKEIIKIGKDICEALNVCHRRDIIHRDIKPDNIFLSDTGDWKLGDFGIARTMEHSTRATKAGTYNYLAPEVFHGEKYGKQVDIYSLGMVLYWLLNKRRRPFLPVDRPPTASEDEQARIKRFRGDPLPAPVCGSEGLKRIVLKACAYHPKDRYASPEEMYMELQAVESEAYQVNASAAAGKDDYDSFDVLESAYEGNGISAGYGNGSDASAGNKTAGAFGYGSAASVGNGSASGSRSSAGEGVSMGNGWEKDDPGSIGNPYRPAGGKNRNDFFGYIDKTEQSVSLEKTNQSDSNNLRNEEMAQSAKKRSQVLVIVCGLTGLIALIIDMMVYKANVLLIDSEEYAKPLIMKNNIVTFLFIILLLVGMILLIKRKRTWLYNISCIFAAFAVYDISDRAVFYLYFKEQGKDPDLYQLIMLVIAFFVASGIYWGFSYVNRTN